MAICYRIIGSCCWEPDRRIELLVLTDWAIGIYVELMIYKGCDRERELFREMLREIKSKDINS